MPSQSDLITKTKILQAAKTLVQDTAVSFTMDALAKQTGFSRATIYRQVGSKKALLQRLAQEHGLPNPTQPDVRSRILQAARTIFGQYGLVTPTMEQIASEADVGVATVYRHFGDRPTLLKSFMEAFQPRLPSDDAQSSGDLTSDLIQLVQSMIQFILQNQDMVRLSFANSAEWQAVLTEVRPFQERSLVRVATFLQSQMELGKLHSVDPHKAATALLGMILSFSLIMPTYYQLPEPEPQDTAVFIVRLFLDGLRKKDPKGLSSKG
jgi:AcrR family transcriptional regulator